MELDSGRKRGFGFVEMAYESSEKTAINDLQDVEWMRDIRVKKADQKNLSRRNIRSNELITKISLQFSYICKLII